MILGFLRHSPRVSNMDPENDFQKMVSFATTPGFHSAAAQHLSLYGDQPDQPGISADIAAKSCRGVSMYSPGKPIWRKLRPRARRVE